MIYQVRRFSKTDNREDASPELLEKAKKEGVIQKVGGDWRIISIKKGKTKALKQNKGFKAAKRADIIGSGVALAGAGMLAANKIKNKKNKENK